MRYTPRFSALTSLAAIGLAVLASAASGQTKDEQTIRALSEQWQRDVAAQNVDKIIANYAPDAVVMMSHIRPVTRTPAIRGMWAEAVKTPGLKLQWTPTKIEVVSPTVATEYGTYTESYDTPQGKATDAGDYVTIWRKINGKWRVALDAPVTSTPLPTPPTEMGDAQLVAASNLTWSDFERPGFDPGIKLAVLHGDPTKSGSYTVRLQLPAGYRFPVHWHPSAENLTVVWGTFLLGMGNTADASALKTYSTGDYIYIPPRHAHFGGSGADGPAVVQLHGQGPFQTIVGVPK